MFVPQKLKLSGFLTFAEDNEQEVDFTSLSLASIAGSNGEGKTTIFHAIVWAIYGEGRVRQDVDSVVNYGSKHAMVTLEAVTDGDVMVRIRRTRTYGRKSALAVQFYNEDNSTWEDQGDHTIDQSQKVIDQIVGMDINVFRSMVYLDQSSNGANLFVNSTSTMRRSILMSLIPDQSVWSDYERKLARRRADAKEKLRHTRTAQESAESSRKRLDTNIVDVKRTLSTMPSEESLVAEIEQYESKIAALRQAQSRSANGADLDALNRELASLRARKREMVRMHKSTISTLTSAIERHNSNVTLLDNTKSQHLALNDRVLELDKDEEEVASAIEDSDKEVSSIEDRLDSAQSELAKAKESLSARRAELVQAQKREGEISNPCHLCGNDMDEGTLHSVQDHAHDEVTSAQKMVADGHERVAKLGEREKTVRKRLSDATSKGKKLLTRQRETLQEIRSVERELDSLEETYSRVKNEVSNSNLNDLTDQLADAQRKLAEADSNSDEDHISERINKLDSDDFSSDIVRCERAISKLRGDIDNRKSLATRLEVTYDEYDVTVQSEKDLQEGIESGVQLVADLDVLTTACSPKGAPSLMIESVLGEISRKQDEFLSDLTGGGKVVGASFTQSRAKKSDKTSSTSEIDILAHLDDGSTRRIETLSPGEQVRVALSNLFAMIEVFNSMKPGLVSWIAMDEPFVHLDDSAIPVAMNIIHEAIDRGVVEFVMIISHQHKVIESATDHLVVGPGDAGRTRIALQQ